MAGGGDEFGVAAASEAGDDAFGVSIIEEGLVTGLGEAVVLKIHCTLEALLTGFEVEGTGEEVGVFEERLGVGWRDEAHGSEVHFYTGLLKAGFGEIL